MNIHSNNYDAIIIGAGISGLVCGCYLAKAGMKVLIVEQHYKPGGYCTSFNRKGFTFDAAAHSFGSYRDDGNFNKILTELGINNLIKIIRINPSDIIVSPDFKIKLSNNISEAINNFSKIFPSEENNIINFYRYFTNKLSNSLFENIKLKNMSFSSFLKNYFTDDILINSIAFPVFGNGGLPPSLMNAFTGTKIFSEFLIDGGYYPTGGLQNLPDALAFLIKENNGHILYRRQVKKILIKNNIVTGVKLDGNESFSSKYVVSACDIRQTYKKFINRPLVNDNFLNKLEHMTQSLSTFILYLGFSKPFPKLPQPGVNIWYLPYYDLDKMFRNINIFDFEKIGGFMVRVSPDRNTMLAFFLAPFKTKLFWRKNKKIIAKKFLNKIENFIPGLKENIACFDAATPHTLYRYTLNYRGANYGWSPLQSQLFDLDFRQKTSFQGLYLTGHWLTQTHGIPGVAYLGHNAAKLILKN